MSLYFFAAERKHSSRTINSNSYTRDLSIHWIISHSSPLLLGHYLCDLTTLSICPFNRKIDFSMFVTPSNYITIYVLFFLLGSFSTTSVAFLLPLQGMVALLGEGVVMLR